MCSLTLTLTLLLHQVGGQLLTLASLLLGQTWYHLYRRLDGPHGLSEWVWKISPPLGFDPQTVYPITNRYIHYTNCYTTVLIETQKSKFNF